jgi:hypothetical protein
MQKLLLFALGAVALTGSATMAAEPLTDQQMDSVAAGFDFPIDLINQLSPIITAAISQPIMPSVGCGTVSTCAVASVVFPSLASPSNGFEVFSNASLPQTDKIATNLNLPNTTTNNPSPITTATVNQPATTSLGCGTASTCSVATIVSLQLALPSNGSEVFSNPPLQQVDKVVAGLNSANNVVINEPGPIVTMAINQPIMTSFGCVTSTCAIAITSIVFPQVAFWP